MKKKDEFKEATKNKIEFKSGHLKIFNAGNHNLETK